MEAAATPHCNDGGGGRVSFGLEPLDGTSASRSRNGRSRIADNALYDGAPDCFIQQAGFTCTFESWRVRSNEMAAPSPGVL
jgi:hypothetical protein